MTSWRDGGLRGRRGGWPGHRYNGAGWIRPDLRWGIRVRDLYRCFWCGGDLLVIGANTLDHVLPVSRGGTHAPTNLITACRRCNVARGDLLLSEWRGARGRIRALRRQLRCPVDRKLGAEHRERFRAGEPMATLQAELIGADYFIPF